MASITAVFFVYEMIMPKYGEIRGMYFINITQKTADNKICRINKELVRRNGKTYVQ